MTAPSETSPVWVVGSGGLLGQGIVRALSDDEAVVRPSVPWADPVAGEAALAELADHLTSGPGSWRLMWCAGAGVTATTAEQLSAEIRTFGRFLDRLATVSAERSRTGTLFLASSAGGVYAGSAAAPFTEATEPRPISPYGEAKLESERLVREFAARSGARVVIGRLANLYGPGQNLAKAQGLISQLCRGQLSRQPLGIYVSLDTTRDYIYVDDAARVAVGCLQRAETQPTGSTTVKIIATQRGTTIAELIGELRRVSHRRALVSLGSSPFAAYQAADLRFRSEVWTELDAEIRTSLATGIHATMRSVMQVPVR